MPGFSRDCVDAVSNLDISGEVSSEEQDFLEKLVVKKEVFTEEEEPLANVEVKKTVCLKRRRRTWHTWLRRSYAIFMLLHPKIFNGNAAAASEKLGIARSTILGWVSTNPKKNCVAK